MGKSKRVAGRFKQKFGKNQQKNAKKLSETNNKNEN